MPFGLETASLCALALAITIGFFRKTNVGMLTIGFALVLSILYKIPGKEIVKGFSSSLFLTMAGVTYLFAIISSNGTLDHLARRIVARIGKNRVVIPIAIYAVGFMLCGIGPGAIPTLAIVAALAVPIAVSSGYNPMLLALIGQMGVQSARMSFITPEAAVVRELMLAQNIEPNIAAVWLSLAVTEFFMIIGVFIFFKGWRFFEVQADIEIECRPFSREEIFSLIGLAAMMVCVVTLKVDVGLTSFLIGSILVACGFADEAKSVKNIPWNVLLMVLGVGILMNIVALSGGIKVLTDMMLHIMTTKTASALMVFISGVMSLFSSGLGVVFPTLIPTAGPLSAAFSGAVNPVELVSMVVVGGTITGFSPASTAGALVMASVATNRQALAINPENKMFVQLILVSFIILAISCTLAICGVYSIICNILS